MGDVVRSYQNALALQILAASNPGYSSLIQQQQQQQQQTQTYNNSQQQSGGVGTGLVKQPRDGRQNNNA